MRLARNRQQEDQGADFRVLQRTVDMPDLKAVLGLGLDLGQRILMVGRRAPHDGPRVGTEADLAIGVAQFDVLAGQVDELE